jgi:hypothetical protein
MISPVDLSDLPLPSAEGFEFTPYMVYRFTGDGRSVWIKAIGSMRPGERLTDSLLFQYARGMQTYFDDVGVRAPHAYEQNEPLQVSSFPAYTPRTVYKYISKVTYERYVSRGISASGPCKGTVISRTRAIRRAIGSRGWPTVALA